MSDIIAIFIIAISLALDAFSVSIAGGLKAQRTRSRDAAKVALAFGGFQAGMPLIGWMLGTVLRGVIAGTGHWIAFILLVGIGLKMLKESTEEQEARNIIDTKTLLLLAVATSIDALVAGVTLSLIHLPLLVSISVIGLITFILSFGGFMFGKRLGSLLGNKAEVLGGLALIGIGIKALLIR